ncbi:MAG: sodium:solute symporter, partial [Muriicola sp.]|nr:sodium:solute symporter [Muriicola sp.]
LFAFGIFTKYQIMDRLVWVVALSCVFIVMGLSYLPADYLGGYEIGYELLPFNGLITFLGLWMIRKRI